MKPDIVLISMDCVRYDTLGIFGGHARTPNIDRFGKESCQIVTDNGFCHATVTPVSHASMLSGVYPPHHGLRELYSTSINFEVPMVQEILLQEGYSTTALVNAHTLDQTYGLGRGFNRYSVMKGEGGARSIVTFAERILKKDRHSPVFLFLHFFTVHERTGSTHRKHIESTHILDELLGPLLELLGNRKDTLTFLTSDHGDDFGRYEVDHGECVYDITMRVPVLVQFPEYCREHVQERELVQHTDFFPTALEVSGARNIPANDGYSLFSVDQPGWTYCEAPKSGKYCIRFSGGRKCVFDSQGKFLGEYNPDTLVAPPEVETLEAAKHIAVGVRTSVPGGPFVEARLMSYLKELGYVDDIFGYVDDTDTTTE